jgi:hypothetical protein
LKFVALGSGIQSHPVLGFPGRPVASPSGISQDNRKAALLVIFRSGALGINNLGMGTGR